MPPETTNISIQPSFYEFLLERIKFLSLFLSLALFVHALGYWAKICGLYKGLDIEYSAIVPSSTASLVMGPIADFFTSSFNRKSMIDLLICLFGFAIYFFRSKIHVAIWNRAEENDVEFYKKLLDSTPFALALLAFFPLSPLSIVICALTIILVTERFLNRDHLILLALLFASLYAHTRLNFNSGKEFVTKKNSCSPAMIEFKSDKTDNLNLLQACWVTEIDGKTILRSLPTETTNDLNPIIIKTSDINSLSFLNRVSYE